MDPKSFVAVSVIWFERYLECSRTYGTEIFPWSVWRFYHSLLNLGPDKLQIKDKVVKYYNETFKPMVEANARRDFKLHNIPPQDIYGREGLLKDNEDDLIVKLFEFITQTIQNSGLGWPTQKEMETFTYNLE